MKERVSQVESRGQQGLGLWDRQHSPESEKLQAQMFLYVQAHYIPIDKTLKE